MYQELYEIAKALIKKDPCMKFCNEKGPLYLKTDTSGIGLGVGLVGEGMNCPCDEAPKTQHGAP